MNIFFDYAKILNAKIESELAKNKQMKPLVELAKKYGIEGANIISFVADLATVAQQLQQLQQEEANE